ncbi:MAG: pyridoxamine 5'-phosphate oxidase [Gammaproteobacteria bacterium]|nr:pyridoxamine 5'-phosphate oxidase [Gammaproteobacteria bacterium]
MEHKTLMDRLTRTSAGADPLELFSRWLKEAEREDLPLPNAVNLATVDAGGQPRARMVLFKGLETEGFVFYTNYHSAKARELEQRPDAALTFWWEPPGRQVRVEGTVRRLDEETSDAYFKTRPRDSQIGAYASRQSEEVADHHQLERQYREIEQQFEGQEIPRPEFWGGYVLVPNLIEFWQDASGRMHDRIRYQRTAEGGWWQDRLSP